MTKTVPIELSETVAQALTTPEGMERARALLEAEFAQDPPLTADDLARALRAKAQLEAGQSVSLEESLSRGQEELRRRANWPISQSVTRFSRRFPSDWA